MLSITTIEDLSVELFHEIFAYFQFHEVFDIFTHLNSRFAAIINNMPLMPVYLGLDGMSIAVTQFYHTYLSQWNVCDRLISLCVSDKSAFGNGLWFASHLSTFNGLRHLSLIDIKRSAFESILDAFSPNTFLIMFAVRFSMYERAAYTFDGVPEGAYHERIFRLFPSLHVCDLRFWQSIPNALDNQVVQPLNEAFMPIKTSLMNLQSIVLSRCSLSFLLHLLEHLRQLQALSFVLSAPWLPDQHLIMNDNKTRVSTINKSLLPNLRRLKITVGYDGDVVNVVDQLFAHDVLNSLTNFTLVGLVSGPDVVHNILFMLSSQCLYALNVWWNVRTEILPSDPSAILLDTVRQLQGRVPIELELSYYDNGYAIKVFTIPRLDKSISIHDSLNKRTLYGQSRCSSSVLLSSNRFRNLNQISVDCTYFSINDKYFTWLSTIIPWNRITSLAIYNPLNSCQLRLLVSKMIHLRTLTVIYYLYDNSHADSNDKNFTDLLNDISLCNILTSNGVQKLDVHGGLEYTDITTIASLIVKHLPHLQILELSGCDSSDSQLPEALYTLINGLSKLSFLTLNGGVTRGSHQYTTLREIWKKDTRPYRGEYYESSDIGLPILYMWL